MTLSNGFIPTGSGGPPSGPAGGDLAGSTYPNPIIATVGGVPAATVAAGAKKVNFTALVPPTITDDSSLGYAVGSRWIDASAGRCYECVDATVGAAVWVETSNQGEGSDSPGFYSLGSIMDYTQAANVTPQEIQYARVWLPKDTVVQSAMIFQVSGGNAARNVRLGLYTQADPKNVNGLPTTLVAQTAITATNPANDLRYVTVNLTASYTTLAAGWHWTAMVTDSALLAFAATEIYEANLVPAWRDTAVALALPSPPGLLVNVESAVVYVALKE